MSNNFSFKPLLDITMYALVMWMAVALLYTKGINSLRGIESFTNIKRLYADGNNLQTI